MFLDQQAKMNDIEIENQELQEHYNNSIHTDSIAEAAGEDPEYYRDVCCAYTLGQMIIENKKLKDEACDYESMRKHRDTLLEESEERFMKIHNLEEELEGWKVIAKNKTKILMKYLPDYNPALMGGSDSENLEECFKQLIEENKKLKQYKD